jgi:hypothetical protein
MQSVTRYGLTGLFCGSAVMVLLSLAPRVSAAVVARVDEFSSDADGFEPTTRDLAGDPGLDGLPPGEWRDIRTGHYGVIEENMSTVGDDPSYPSADPGAATPEYAVLQTLDTTGPYGFSDYPLDSGVIFRIDHYADPTIVSNGPSLDFWWDNAVGDAAFNAVAETGIAADAGVGTYNYRTTSNVDIATVPSGNWYELELIIQAGPDGTLDGIHNVWDATHTQLLGSTTLSQLTGDPANQPIAPYYYWFTNFLPNVDVLFLDDMEIVSVPEPTGFAMLGLAGMFLRRRRGAR